MATKRVGHNDIYDQIDGHVKKLIDSYKKHVADGKLSFQDATSLCMQAFTGIVDVVKHFGSDHLTPEERKQCALECLDRFYDEVIAPINIKAIPDFIEPAFDQVGNTLLLNLAKLAVDGLFSVMPEKHESGDLLVWKHSMSPETTA